MPKYSVMLAQFPGDYSTRPDPTDWITETAIQCKFDPRIDVLAPWRKSDTPITMVRNRCVRDALAGGFDYLLMIDNDMEPDARDEQGRWRRRGAQPFWQTAWEFMLRHRDSPGAIASPYLGPSPWNNVYVFLWRNKNNRPENFSLEQFTREEAAGRGGIEEVAALPTGLILYDMRVFHALPLPWFYYEYTDLYQSEKSSTEDVVQTRDMSLAWYVSQGRKGGRIYCAWDSWSRHIKLEHIDPPELATVALVGEELKQVVLAERSPDEKLVMIGADHDFGNGQKIGRGAASAPVGSGAAALPDPGRI